MPRGAVRRRGLRRGVRAGLLPGRQCHDAVGHPDLVRGGAVPAAAGRALRGRDDGHGRGDRTVRLDAHRGADRGDGDHPRTVDHERCPRRDSATRCDPSVAVQPLLVAVRRSDPRSARIRRSREGPVDLGRLRRDIPGCWPGRESVRRTFRASKSPPGVGFLMVVWRCRRRRGFCGSAVARRSRCLVASGIFDSGLRGRGRDDDGRGRRSALRAGGPRVDAARCLGGGAVTAERPAVPVHDERYRVRQRRRGREDGRGAWSIGFGLEGRVADFPWLRHSDRRRDRPRQDRVRRSRP